ncbi:hypothetical protein [Deinococcus peraridilitoris]|uniref:hypothetical protein n=1 Tax=Deinococcus peraridilitoris TaxID=432329 RepID=UPI001FE0B126|nr:hypothetical protein [Deinococcus peraridilitoris]
MSNVTVDAPSARAPVNCSDGPLGDFRRVTVQRLTDEGGEYGFVNASIRSAFKGVHVITPFILPIPFTLTRWYGIERKKLILTPGLTGSDLELA